MSTARKHDLTGPRRPGGVNQALARASSSRNAPITEPPPPWQSLPLDLQVEIAARSDDVATVVRCAAASKPLRRNILGQDFRRRLALRMEANGGFKPGLLVAVSFWLRDHGSGSDCFVAQPSRRLRFDHRILRSFEPASMRDGILVLCRDKVLRRTPGLVGETAVELLVCNTFTGHVASLPLMDLARGRGTRGIYCPALLTLDAAGRSFEVLVIEQQMLIIRPYLRIQTFSSRDGEWGAARHVYMPPGHRNIWVATATAPAVIGRTAHWLCFSVTDVASVNRGLIILGLHSNSVQATAIALPKGCVTGVAGSTRLMMERRAEGLILGTAAEGTRLSLVIGEPLVISMWTLLPEEGPAAGWSRQVVIRKQAIERQINSLNTTDLEAHQRIRFEVFGERSGTVLFWMERVGLVQLNLATKKALVLRSFSERDNIDVGLAFVHEVDLASLFQGMKLF